MCCPFFTNCSICIQYTSNLIRIHLILSAALNSLIEYPFFFCGCWKKYQITIRWSNSICLFFFRILKAGIPFNRTSLFLLDVTFARQNTTEIAFNVNVNRMSLFLFSFAKSTTSLVGEVCLPKVGMEMFPEASVVAAIKISHTQAIAVKHWSDRPK